MIKARKQHRGLLWVFVMGLWTVPLCGAPRHVSFSQSSAKVETYDFLEIAVRVEQPDAGNPFTETQVTGRFRRGNEPYVAVEGFCDAADGSRYCIRFMPVLTGEYRYEDHYPARWGQGRVAPARSTDTRRRLAWEISMAGAYQTTGERADTDTGGGWINGRGDDAMVMLKGYGHIVDFFTSIPWWTTNPNNNLVDNQALCLADPGKVYIVYIAQGGKIQIEMLSGQYTAKWFNPRNGAWTLLPAVEVKRRSWTSPEAENSEDWVLLLRKRG